MQENGGWFSWSADEVCDVSNQEQLAITIRYVDIKDKIQEDFIGFVNVSDGTDGENISKKILSHLQSRHLNLNKMRAQCYDGAANMSGKTKGVANRIKEQYPKALSLWCAAHQLNRCVVQACTIQEVRNMMTTADQVVKFFEFSPKKQNILVEKVNKILKEGTRRTKLKELCRTRWVERHDAFEVLIDLYEPIVETLEHFATLPNTRTPGMADANSLLHAVTRFDFIILIFKLY